VGVVEITLLFGIVICFAIALTVMLLARLGVARSLQVIGYVAAFLGILLTSLRLYLIGYTSWWVVLLIAFFLALAVGKRMKR